GTPPNRKPKTTAARWSARAGGGWIAATLIGATSVGASTLAGSGPATGEGDERPSRLTLNRHDCIVRDGRGDQLPAQEGSGSCHTEHPFDPVPLTVGTSGWVMTRSPSGAGSSVPSTS